MGLYEGESFEKFVEGAKATWHSDEGFGVFHKHYFARKEIVEFDVLVVVNIRVVGLLEGQVDIESGRYAFVEVSAFVSGFHNAGASAGDDAKAFVDYFLGNTHGEVVVGGSGIDACRSEDAYAGAYGAHLFITVNKFTHYFKNRPRVVCFGFVPNFRMFFHLNFELSVKS